jgi:response regulator RpfG family c-di-GMP phosphodiesterase
MPKETFKYLWDCLKKGEKVNLEVKNKKKDGGYYWVEAEFEPYFDSKGNHVGYSAVRKDITANKDIEDIQREIIFTMGTIGESRSKETGNHVKRVAEYSYLLANLSGRLKEEECELLKQASPMHDIGKVAIPDSILHKSDKLNNLELEIMKTHAIKGYDLLKNSNRPLLKMAAIVAKEHHEKWDGSGYPVGLKEEEISIYGRITAICDVFDALGSDRCYKKAWKDEEIFKYLKDEREKQFDPKLIDIFFDNLDKFLFIREKYKDIF